MPKITGGHLLVRSLRAHGVTRIFTLPGAGIFPVYEACRTEGIDVVGGRHEAAVVQTAEGWARVSGRPGVAILAEGPGHANGIPGMATAFAECSPLVMVSGTDDSRNLGRGAIQELPQIAMCAPVAKRSALVTDPLRIAAQVEASFRAATGGVAGPVHLSIPADVLDRLVPASTPTAVAPGVAPEAPPAAFVDEAIGMLAEASRPVIVAGIMAFWSGSAEPLRRLIEATHIPLFTVERARGLVPDGHPGCFGDGYTSVNPVAEAIHHADVVLVLGDKIDCRFAYGSSFGQARVIHVCPDRAEIGRACPVELGCTADVRAVTEALLAAAAGRAWPERRAWLDTLGDARRRHAAETLRLRAIDSSPPHPARIAAEVDALADDRTIYVFDGGDFSGWVRHVLGARRPAGWQIGTCLGHLGTGLPYAIGAQLADPDARVVLLTGDGSLGFCMMEFETAVRQRLPIVVVVGNDAAWGIEEFFQEKQYGPERPLATPLTNTRWDRMAQAMGGWGERVERLEDLRPALERAFAAGGPACVDVVIPRVPSPLALAFARVFARRRRLAQ